MTSSAVPCRTVIGHGTCEIFSSFSDDEGEKLAALADEVVIPRNEYLFKENAWLGIRLSGTEPIVRLYFEADSKKNLDKLKLSSKKLISKK